MPRSYRIKSLTDIYHIMVRGVNKEVIFHDDADRKKFLQIMEYYLNKYEVEIYAYCLMDNHVHFLLKSKEYFNKFMQCIQTVYANHFNKKYKRIGHLFQDRFKSIPVEEEKYLLECIRYIHQNPVKANISTIEKYKWSSYNKYIKGSKLINTKFVLKLFSTDKQVAVNNYKEYMKIISKEADIRNSAIEDKITDDEVIKFIENLFKIKIDTIKKLDIIERNILLTRIISLEIVNILQLSRVTGINRNILRKIDKRRKTGGPKVV